MPALQLAARRLDAPDDSEYFRLLKTRKIPDLRGVFIRGLNEFEKGKTTTKELGDPETNREAGSYQEDTLEKHNHSTLHSHSGLDGTKGSKLSIERGWFGDEGLHPIAVDVGGLENRPKNVAVYYYIRIN